MKVAAVTLLLLFGGFMYNRFRVTHRQKVVIQNQKEEVEIQKSLVAQLKKHYKVKNLGVRQGPFYVLLGATMPSVLVETAFLSNREEEKLLKNRKYQERTADAIVAAVRNYATALNLLAVK